MTKKQYQLLLAMGGSVGFGVGYLIARYDGVFGLLVIILTAMIAVLGVMEE